MLQVVPSRRVRLTSPVAGDAGWCVWIVVGRVVTHSLYKEGARVVYRPETDDDACAFARWMADLNPRCADADVVGAGEHGLNAF